LLSDWIEVLDSGSHFVSGISGLFTSSTNVAEDRIFVRELEPGRIYDSSTDIARDALFVAGQTFDGHPYIRYFSLNSFELAQEIAVPPQTFFVHAAGIPFTTSRSARPLQWSAACLILHGRRDQPTAGRRVRPLANRAAPG